MHAKPGSNVKNDAGFTLIEVIVIVAILAILAGILAPMIFSQIDEAKITRATSDAKAINTAILVFRKDIGQWPNKDGECAPNLTLLTGDGTLPSNLAAFGFDTRNKAFFADSLETDDNNCWPNTWKGPYLKMVTADPWGNAYFLNPGNFDVSGGAVWVYSAGPNGLVETFAGAMASGGDDIGIRVK
jgi:general secretion pathway protein G